MLLLVWLGASVSTIGRGRKGRYVGNIQGGPKRGFTGRIVVIGDIPVESRLPEHLQRRGIGVGNGRLIPQDPVVSGIRHIEASVRCQGHAPRTIQGIGGGRRQPLVPGPQIHVDLPDDLVGPAIIRPGIPKKQDPVVVLV